MGESCHTNHGNCSCPCHSNHGKCNCPCHHKHESCKGEENGDDKMEWFLELADKAWEEVLKEKIKDHIRSTHDQQMSELAKIVSEANSQRWKLKMEKKKIVGEFQQKLCGFFSSKK